MKSHFLHIFILMVFCVTLSAQNTEPAIMFSETPRSYSMHICSDGLNYYTVNGGVPEDGCIFKYSLKGEFIAAFPVELDMRSIVYNKKDKSFYVNTIDKKIFKIVDMKAGTYELVYENLYDNEQASLAMDSKGKSLLFMNSGTLSIYKFKTGELDRVLAGLKCGDGNRKGSGTVAVADNVLYTWDADAKKIYAYNWEGIYLKEYSISSGDFGYSLSSANGLIFVSHSEKGKKATWYGYNLSQ